VKVILIGNKGFVVTGHYEVTQQENNIIKYIFNTKTENRTKS
jgi:hypothetical protein